MALRSPLVEKVAGQEGEDAAEWQIV